MEELSVSKNIHLMPMGYEHERVVKPAKDYDADCVILIHYDPGPAATGKNVIEPKYHDQVREELEKAGIQVEEVRCDIFDLYSSLGTIARLAAEFKTDNVYVNLASGSKVTAIGGMIACMATGAIPYYVKADSYAGNPEQEPVAWDATDVVQLPKYPIDPPDEQHIACLDYIKKHQPVTKQNLIDFGETEKLPFYAHYNTENVNNPARGYYRRLDSQIINPLTTKEYIKVVERSKYRYISLTESGKNTLEAFQYLWKNEAPLFSEQL